MEVIDELCKLVQPGDFVFDVGANVGDVAEPLAQRVGPAGRVYAFEPAPRVFSILQDRLRSYQCAMALPFAIGDAPDCRKVFHHYDWTLLNADDPRRGTNVYHQGSYPHLKQPEPFDIEVVTLDYLTEMFHIIPNFVKIDVDGWEAKVVKGMREILTSAGHTLVVVEVGAYTLAKLGDDIADVTEPFFQNHFKAFRFPTMEPLPDTKTIRALCPRDGTMDILFK